MSFFPGGYTSDPVVADMQLALFREKTRSEFMSAQLGESLGTSRGIDRTKILVATNHCDACSHSYSAV